MKIAVVTCYHDPDYVRARVLRAALKQILGVKPIVIKNDHQGMLRYPEVIYKLWQVRKQRPDAYLLTFRGQEMLPIVLLLAGKKPVIFDELIVPIAYATTEQHSKTLTKRLYYFLAKRGQWLYERWLGKCRSILADTSAHAELSARMSNVNLSKYTVIPVGADEALLKVGSRAKPATDNKFKVLYWSTGMQPLHGVPTVLQAAIELQANEQVEFQIIGGKRPMRQAVAAAVAEGAHITHHEWLPLSQLVDMVNQSSLLLGGPFGDTAQAQHVITTKTYQGLACGVPVLLGANQAAEEYFRDKDNALVVPQADVKALVKAIRWADTHPTELQAMAARGRKLYEKQFSTEAIARLLQPLVSNL